ncbi:MAG: gephyrin-like molybdotransferase Glp [Bacteroidia bacterium]
MISVEKAHSLILKNTTVLEPSNTLLVDALGSVVSKTVLSPVNLPLFNQSAMDGYAFLFSDYKRKKVIKIIGKVPAGKTFKGKIVSGQAVRIFTGAPVPSGLDTVVMQERITLKGEVLFIMDLDITKGANIRKTGSQIKRGKIALPKCSLITPGGVGYLAAMGITKIHTTPHPRITLVVTGSELKKPGKSLVNGEIYESNSYALVATLKSIGLNVHKVISIPDSRKQTVAVLKRIFIQSDLILVTGGISVGEYDFVGSALTELGVKNIFYKIKQKPGKPLFFGKNNRTIIFGLPGNPAAVLSCFYEYVYPCINVMRGKKDVFLRKIQLPITIDYPKKKGLSFFLKGKMSESSVTPLVRQESYILSSFAVADCLIYLPEKREHIKAGELVDVHVLPGLY